MTSWVLWLDRWHIGSEETWYEAELFYDSRENLLLAAQAELDGCRPGDRVRVQALAMSDETLDYETLLDETREVA